MGRSTCRGNKIIFVFGIPLYPDTLEQCFLNPRPCKRCGNKPNENGEDSCIGHIEGATSACCGHGVEPSYQING